MTNGSTGYMGRVVDHDVIGWRSVRGLVRGAVIEDVRQTSTPGGFVITARADGVEMHLEARPGADGIGFYYQADRKI